MKIINKILKVISRSPDCKSQIKYLENKVANYQERESEYQQLFDVMQDGVLVYNGDGIITSANKAAQEILGLSLQQIIGQHSDDHEWNAIHEDGTYFSKEEHPSIRAANTGKQVENVIMGIINSKLNRRSWFSVSSTPLIHKKKRKPYQVHTILRNITGNRNLGEDIKEATRRLTTLMDNLPGIAYRCDFDELWTMEFISNGCMVLTGYEPSVFLGNIQKAYVDIIYNHDKIMVWDKINESLENSDTFELEYRIVTKSGEIRWVWERGKLVGINEDNTQKLEGFITDITDFKNAELVIQKKNKELHESLNRIKHINTELEEAKKRAEESDLLKTEFLRNVSHEIRSPINAIMGYTELLENYSIPPERRKHYTSVVKQSCRQLLRIMDDILEASTLITKQATVQTEPINLSSLFAEIFKVFQPKAVKKQLILGLKEELSYSKSTIISDRKKLKKILSRLIENAIKYTDEGFIEAGYRLKADIDPAEIEFYVKDTGIGIAKEKQSLIFKQFVQENADVSGKVGGLGLSLSLVKEITELLGGRIQLLSKKGQGSTFFINLPYIYANGDNVTNDQSQET